MEPLVTQRRPNRSERRRDSSWQGRRAPVEARSARPQRRSPLNPAAVGIVVTIIAVIAAVAYLIYDTSKASPPAPDLDTSASIPGTYYPPQGREHLQPGQTYDRYTSNPPTSGSHAPIWADWSIHQDPVPKEQLVHNLEHGGVAVVYNCPSGCDDIKKALTDYVQQRLRNGDSIVMAPYPGMDHRIAVMSWTRLDAFDDLDMNRVDRFVDKNICRFDPEHLCKS